MESQNNRSRFRNIILVILKLTIIVVGLDIILSIAVLYTIDYIRVKAFHPPERLASIPEGAVWKGGPDGGYWYYLHGKKDSIYTIEIFNDYTGTSHNKEFYDNELSFIACPECKMQTDTISNIIQHINFCSFNKIYLLDIWDQNNKLCYLELLSEQKKKNVP